jgi:YVTN family beta-propeller protein
MVVAPRPGELDLFDPHSYRTTGNVKFGSMPHWIAATSDNQFAYVTNEHSNDVTVVDLSSGSVTARIPVGKAPRKIVIQPTPGEQSEQARRPPRIVRPGQ